MFIESPRTSYKTAAFKCTHTCTQHPEYSKCLFNCSHTWSISSIQWGQKAQRCPHTGFSFSLEVCWNIAIYMVLMLTETERFFSVYYSATRPHRTSPVLPPTVSKWRLMFLRGHYLNWGLAGLESRDPSHWQLPGHFALGGGGGFFVLNLAHRGQHWLRAGLSRVMDLVVWEREAEKRKPKAGG